MRPPQIAGSRAGLLVRLGVLLALFQVVHLFAAGIARARSPDLAWPRAIRVDVNRAPVAELMTLPGIGRGRAAAIVLHRVRHGPFRCAEALMAVEGIGGGTFQRLRRHVALGRR